MVQRAERQSRVRLAGGFAAFTVSRSQIETIVNYIRNQEQHHAKRDFAAEFVALLKKHLIEYDPRYVLG